MPVAFLSRVLLGGSLVLVLAGCQGSTPRLPAAGPVQPTVAGRAPVGWQDAATARDAFTRQAADGTVTATLQDASWLRFAGPPEEVEQRYRAYFLEGYTTFDVVLVTEELGKPTEETFLLEDSAGRRAVSRPVRYEGQMGSGRGGFASQFELSFQHAITQDTRWLRLTRQSTGTTVEWRF